MKTVREFEVMDYSGNTFPAQGYQQANQLAMQHLKNSDVALIVIRVTKQQEPSA